MRQILLIDDDPSLRRVMEFQLQEAGYSVVTASDGKQGLVLFQQQRPEMVITDVQMPGVGGYDVLKSVLELEPQTIVIIVTAFSTVEQAVDAMKVGAYDYLSKPFSRDQLCLTVAKAFEFSELRRENNQLRDVLADREGEPQIIGRSPLMKQLMQRVEKVAATQASILISGESGTGKEVIAQAIHHSSERRQGPFVAVNCAAIPKDLIESELFGHVKGSFTGAVRDRKGKFRLAHKGTLFLDEIGELPVDLQPKLLRALQGQQIEPVGGVAEKVDVRVISATNRNLDDAMANGTFRDDLYYRLAVVPLEVPPLRQRKEDIPLFLEHFLKQQAGSANIRFSEKVFNAFQGYDWPGNVRELENVVEQMLILRSRDLIDIEDLPQRMGRPVTTGSRVLSLPAEGYALEDLEKEAVLEALARCGGNKSKAAAFLRIPRHTLLYRLEKYKINSI